MRLPDERTTRVPLMPITLAGKRQGVRSSPPQVGEHSVAVLTEIGYTVEQIDKLKADQVMR